jgi:serine/threonine protein kinase
MIELNIPKTTKVKISKRYQATIHRILHNGIIMQYKREGNQFVKNTEKERPFILTKAEPIGIGGFGVVLRGMYNNQNVVIKIINGTKTIPVHTINDMPPNAPIVNILGYSKYYFEENKYEFIRSRADDTVVILMEELNGGTLNELIINCKENPEIINQYGGLEYIIATIGIRISIILDTIHNCVTHNCHLMYGDIKPSNILFNNNREPILIDIDTFLFQSTEGTLSFGTPGYFPLCKYKANKCDYAGNNAADDYEMLVITLLDIAMLNNEGPHNTYKNRRKLLILEPTDSQIVHELKSLLRKLQIRARKTESHTTFSNMLKDILEPYLKNKLECTEKVIDTKNVSKKSKRLVILSKVKQSKKSKHSIKKSNI